MKETSTLHIKKSKHDIDDIDDLRQSRLVQIAMNQKDPNAISRLIPSLGAYGINKPYIIDQNIEGINTAYTLFHWACEYGHLRIVEKLFKNKYFNRACLNLQNYSGHTPLHLAVRNAHKSCLQSILQPKTYNNYLQIIQMLLEDPDINVNKQDCNIGSPFHYAILYGNEPLIDMFLKCSKTEFNAVNKHKSTLTHLLVSRNNPKIFKFVFKHYYDKIHFHEQLTAKDLDGHSPLDLVATQFIKARLPQSKKNTWVNESSGPLLKFLLKHTQANDIPSLFKNGNALFHKIIEIGNANLKLFDLLFYSENPYITNQLYLRNNQGFTPLGLALEKYGQPYLESKIQYNLEAIIKMLLDDYPIQAQPNATTNDYHELHLIVSLHSNNALPKRQKIFLEESAKKLINKSLGLVNQLNNSNETPLHIAIKTSNPTMVKILFNDTKLSQVDIHGNTVFDLMVEDPEMVEVFLDLIKIGQIQFDFNDKRSQIAFHFIFNLLLEKVANRFLEDAQDAELAQYMKYIYRLEEYYTDVPMTSKLQCGIIEPIKRTEAEKLNKEKCVICFEPLFLTKNNMEQITKIKACGHSFHAWCFTKLCYCHHKNKNKNQLTCPACRGTI